MISVRTHITRPKPMYHGVNQSNLISFVLLKTFLENHNNEAKMCEHCLVTLYNHVVTRTLIQRLHNLCAKFKRRK